MALVKILVINLLLQNNEVAKFGDVIDADKLTGTLDERIKDGYVELVEEEKEAIAADQVIINEVIAPVLPVGDAPVVTTEPVITEPIVTDPVITEEEIAPIVNPAAAIKNAVKGK